MSSYLAYYNLHREMPSCRAGLAYTWRRLNFTSITPSHHNLPPAPCLEDGREEISEEVLLGSLRGSVFYDRGNLSRRENEIVPNKMNRDPDEGRLPSSVGTSLRSQ
jgi:hypothetical protein